MVEDFQERLEKHHDHGADQNPNWPKYLKPAEDAEAMLTADAVASVSYKTSTLITLSIEEITVTPKTPSAIAAPTRLLHGS